MIVMVTLILTACSFGANLTKMSENRMLSKMKAKEENQYHLYSFWTSFPYSNWEETEIDDELKHEFEIYTNKFDYSRVDTSIVRLLSFHQTDSEYIELLKITEFPTFIVLDKEGIVLRTTDVNEINEFLNDFQLEKFKEE